MVPLKDVDALYKALEYLLVDLQLREHMAAVGHEIALREFSQEQVAAETVRLCNEVLP